jgi:hypothetical protein
MCVRHSHPSKVTYSNTRAGGIDQINRTNSVYVLYDVVSLREYFYVFTFRVMICARGRRSWPRVIVRTFSIVYAMCVLRSRSGAFRFSPLASSSRNTAFSTPSLAELSKMLSKLLKCTI